MNFDLFCNKQEKNAAIRTFLKFQKKKKLFQTDDFSQQNTKKFKNFKKDTEMYNKEYC